MYQICIVFDDMLDQTAVMKHNNTLNSLFVRGRHFYITTICSSQVYRGVSMTARKNLTDLFLFRIPNSLELEAISEETSALASKKDFMSMYKKCISIPYNFLWVAFKANDEDDIFHNGFNSKFKIT